MSDLDLSFHEAVLLKALIRDAVESGRISQFAQPGTIRAEVGVLYARCGGDPEDLVWSDR